MKKKKIFVFTGSRADYGILFSLIKKIYNDSKIQIKIIICGQHYSSYHGNTFKEIKKDFPKNIIGTKIIIKNSNSKKIVNYISREVEKINLILNKEKPDMNILLGDRYEIFSAAIASYYNNIKIAHLHGGEVTHGSLDDSIRHSISKLSDIHFVCHTQYKKRLIQMGESPKNIFNYGSLAVERLVKEKKMNREKLVKKFKLNKNKKLFLITFNAYQYDEIHPIKIVKNLLNILDSLNNVQFIFSLSNSDNYSDEINNYIIKFCKKKKDAKYFKSLGFKYYSSLMKISDLVIGNSSSGIIEAPKFKLPVINIGNRQKGRVMMKNIFSVSGDFSSLKESIINILKKKKINFKQENEFYKKNTTNKIYAKIIESIKVKKRNKKFLDINH